mmetsp:Transcript_133633/g.188856  ORF Transcript_133633/g.188856 Transcript_133633/m.188856 type:complete len:121 (-) Transcript_133633:78-440(-)
MPFCSNSFGALSVGVWPGCGFQMGSLSCMCLCMPDAAAPISKTLLVADENGQIVVRSRSGLAPISESSLEEVPDATRPCTAKHSEPSGVDRGAGVGLDMRAEQATEIHNLATFLPADWAD